MHHAASSRFRLPLILVLFLAPVVGCTHSSKGSGGSTGSSSASSTSSSTGASMCGASGSDLVAKFDLPASGLPNVLDVPFPSDIYLDSKGNPASTFTGTEKIFPKKGGAVFGQFVLAGSFGSSGGSIFAIEKDTAIDPATLADEAHCSTPGASAFLIDLDAASPAEAMLPCIATYYDERARGVPTTPAIVIRPARGTIPPSGHHVASLITTAVHSMDGKALQPSTTFAAIMGGDHAGAKKLYGDAIDKAVALGIPACSIAALTTWKTYDYDADMIAARQALNGTTPPTLAWDPQSLAPMGLALFAPTIPAGSPEYVATLDQYLGTPNKAPSTFYGGAIDDPGDDIDAIAHDQIGALGTAVFQAPNFMVGDDAGLDPSSPAYNQFYRDSNGLPAVDPMKKTNTIWVTIAIPKSAPPPNGYPVVIWQHGFGADRTDMYAAMNVFAKEGWATVAINLVAHGVRAYPNAAPLLHTDKVAHRADFPLTKETTFGTYDGPDGQSDAEGGATDFVGSFLGYLTLRDQIRQSALDLSSLVRLIQAGADLGPMTKAVPGAKLDGNNVVFFGVSFGAIVGTLFLAEEPAVRHAVLDVGGAGLATTLTNHSPNIASQTAVIFQSVYGLGMNTFVPSDSPALNVIQGLVDPADPLTMAAHVTRSPLSFGGTMNSKKDVLSIMVQWDEWVPNDANLALAKAMGLSVATPHLPFDLTIPEVDGSSGSVSGSSPFGLLVEESPAPHGYNVTGQNGTRHYQAGFPFYSTATDFTSLFPKLANPAKFPSPIYSSLTAMTSFYRTSMAGGTIKVDGLVPPVAIPMGN